MKSLRLVIGLILLFAVLCCRAEDNSFLRVVSYNVENLFDCRHDSLKADTAFLAEGAYHWTEARYREKLHHIAQVICGTGGWQAPALVGLMEVENDSCLYRLCRYYLRRSRYPYRYIHYESPDVRGVDVALLFDSTRLRCVSSRAIPVPALSDFRPTRDILYAEMRPVHGTFASSSRKDTSEVSLHCFVCHFPSQLGGAAATAERRLQAASVLQQQIDSLLRTDSTSLILVMGDFNTQADARLLSGVHNLMLPYAERHLGTHKYHGEWSCLDQFWVSDPLLSLLAQPTLTEPLPDDLQADFHSDSESDTQSDSESDHPSDSKALIYAPSWLLEADDRYLGLRPKRTYIGPRYHAGYSDHLPIILDIRL